MATRKKAIISRRDGAACSPTDFRRIKIPGIRVEASLPHGILASGAVNHFQNLEAAGYRVTTLPDSGILHIGGYRIDIGKPLRVPPALEVPSGLRKTWPHHLVQLIAPSIPEWVRRIEAMDVDIVEPIGAYGLFVVGTPGAAARLKKLPFVSWVGPFKPAYRIVPELAGREGFIQYVSIGVYGSDELAGVRNVVSGTGGTIIKEWEPGTSHRSQYRVLIVEVDRNGILELARFPHVRWLEFQAPVLIPDHEWATQIVAENFDIAAAPFSIPVPGYQAFLEGLGLSGAGVTIGICDSGVDTNDNATMHPDLKGRMTFFKDWTNGTTLVDGWMNDVTNPDGTISKAVSDGHGTHVAGIALGNATTGVKDSEGFLIGQGIAPGASFGVINNTALGSTGTDPFTDLTHVLIQNDVSVMNNSWKDGLPQGYSSKVAAIDSAVRDADTASSLPKPLTIVFSAGNNGPGSKSIAHPHEGKNTIVVGSSYSWFSNLVDARAVAPDSSRGPSADDRVLPTVVAPGYYVNSTRSRVDADPNTPGVQQPGISMADGLTSAVYPDYARLEGTSMAAPQVSGLCALLVEWWRQRTGGRNPSPAMLKALVINGAEDIDNAPTLRNFSIDDFVQDASGILHRANFGFAPLGVYREKKKLGPGTPKKAILPMTEVNSVDELDTSVAQWFYDKATDIFYSTFQNIWALDPKHGSGVPNNDQGWGRISLPNIVLQAPGSDRGPRIFMDQRHAFTANGQEFKMRVAAVDSSSPLRVTLVWTDCAGAANAGLELVNNLDLEVNQTDGGATTLYKGNVFTGGFSVPGGDADFRNNIECVYIKSPTGVLEIVVRAAALKADARPPNSMDKPWQDFALVIENAKVSSESPVNVAIVLDCSGSMVTSGYVDATRTSSQGFIDQMLPDDGIAIVSFSGVGKVEFPAGLDAVIPKIDGQPVVDSAKKAINNISFGGCTNMADGILKATTLFKDSKASGSMVLFSDGYDNKGCDENNPAKPWAKDVVASLPGDLSLYTCAMGPASDQKLLSDLAKAGRGLYFYMPSIDDLFEIYNYIRGEITGDGIIANESGTASSSQVKAFVETGVTRARFNVMWADPSVHFVLGDPKDSGDLTVRLRDPGGRVLHPSTSTVGRIEGQGYAGFDIHEPLAGEWRIEIHTADDTHVRYTAGAFVTSPVEFSLGTSRPTQAAKQVSVKAHVRAGSTPVLQASANVRVIAPKHGVQSLLIQHRPALKKLKLPPPLSGDSLPDDIGRLIAFRNQRLQAGTADIFAHHSFPVRLARRSAQPALTGSFVPAVRGTTYNVVATVNGVLPGSGSRFIRKRLVSVFVK